MLFENHLSEFPILFLDDRENVFSGLSPRRTYTRLERYLLPSVMEKQGNKPDFIAHSVPLICNRSHANNRESPISLHNDYTENSYYLFLCYKYTVKSHHCFNVFVVE